ncbi:MULTISPECIES: LysR family transcriptional regulator [Oceanospirillaceae]|uniref:LysR substrate-binding domain-containing protein n=1 Tax=Oceanobacter antarcticus TaxID=3133425 RepID=A0ABW8NIQ7_9GAMM|tara:strand:- start:43096 stop:43992 length:897 start_codon:yes stop_codon:yes gene_type:complete
MTAKQLRAFLAVARTLSFAEASTQVHLSQPALSLAIKNLEDTLGGRLLSRTTRSVALTPEGQALLPIARRLMADWDNAEEQLQKRFALKLGQVAIAAMPSFAASLLPQALKVYRQRFPDVRVEVHDVVAEQVVSMVRSGRIEVGVSLSPDGASDLGFMPLFNDEFVAVLPPNSTLSATMPAQLPWARLLMEDFIALQRPSIVRLMLENRLAEHNMALNVAYDAHQLATVGRMVAAGLGVSAVPSLCRQQMEEMGAVCVPLQDPTIGREVGILVKKGHELSVAAQALVDVLGESLGQRG